MSGERRGAPPTLLAADQEYARVDATLDRLIALAAANADGRDRVTSFMMTAGVLEQALCQSQLPEAALTRVVRVAAMACMRLAEHHDAQPVEPS